MSQPRNVVPIMVRENVPDVERSSRAYEATDHGSESKFRERLSLNYLQPSDSDLARAAELITSGGLRMVVPMRESQPVAGPMLQMVIRKNGFNPRWMVVVNDDSHPSAVEEVNRFGVRVINRNCILDCVDWPRLLPVLNLEEVPRGKGVAVLAGYLVQFVLAERHGTPIAVIQHDSEIQGYTQYRALEYLAFGIMNVADAAYVKIAKSGRGNERCMAVRNLMDVVATCPLLNTAIRERARQLFDRLTPHKWMLTGEFSLEWSLAMNRPFATGYLEETLITAYCEDTFARRKKGCTAHVANPHPRNDGANDERKESIMQQQISNFVAMLALEADPVDMWGLQEIARLNQTCMARPIRVGWIPLADDRDLCNEPVQGEIIRNDRIIPSVTTLVEDNFVDMNALRRLVS